MASQHRDAHIAIVGIAAKLPSGEHSQDNLDYYSFWKFLLDKRQATEKIPQDRLDGISGHVPSIPGTFLKETTKFDNVEFGIATKDALAMTASTRSVIEMSFLALLDSGIDSRGKKIGTFACGTNAESWGTDQADRGFGSSSNTLANRVAYTLNLTGPSLFIDTACSSTLTAMHLAIRSIESGDCEAAIIGGCQQNMNLWDWATYLNGGVASPDGCKPFDASANGFIKGEGAVAIVVKPLEKALADTDHIYAVVLGTAINSNGARAPLHAPSGPAQRECILNAFSAAGRDPKEVDFVELHATGTAVGDPIEANSAGELFSRPDDVLVGSVKGNLGHLESTAFLASLVKACLVLENKVIPPNANFNTPNPKIQWEAYRLKVPTKPIPLGCRSSTGRSLISLASSGIGGSNGHVVLEGAPNMSSPVSSVHSDTSVLFIVGGLSPRATQEISTFLVEMLMKNSSKEALSQAVTHSRRARQLPWRTYFIFTPGSPTQPTIENPVLIPKVRPPVVFVFSGQGPQHIAMGRRLFRTHHIFRESIERLDSTYKQVTGVSFIETTGLFTDTAPSTLPVVWSSDITIPAMTMIQIALFDLFVSLGVKPDVLVGHSAGETPMMYASGASSAEMALEVAIARGRAMKLTEPLGAGMAAVGCGVDRASSLIKRVKSEQGGVLEIACHNSPDATVLSGSSHLVDRAIEIAQTIGIFARRVQTQNPSHSSLMEKCRVEYQAGVNHIFSRYTGSHKPVIPCYSTVGGHGKFIKEFIADYFWDNIRQPVHFHQAVSSIITDFPDPAFVEISPHPALSSYIAALGVPSSSITCPMKRPSRNAAGSHHLELVTFAESLARLATLGINSIDLTSLYGRASRDPIFSVPYPFTTRKFPLRIDGPREPEGSQGGACSLRLKMNSTTHADLAEHIINGEPIVPAAAFIDMLLQTGARLLWDLEFKSILSLASENPTEVRVEHEGSKWRLKTLIKNPLAPKVIDELIHSTGFSSNNSTMVLPNLDLPKISSRLPTLPIDTLYDSLKPSADFGPIFQRLKSLRGGADEGLAEVVTFAEYDSSKNYVFHPVILDACLHYVLHPDIMQNLDADSTFLPSKLRKFAYYSSPMPDESVFSYYVLRRWTPDTRLFDFTLCDKAGSVLCIMHGLELKRVSSIPVPVVKQRYDLVFQPVLADVVSPRHERLWSRPDRKYVDAVHTIVDHQARDVLKKSLEGELVIGEELHRQRYADFAREAIHRKLPPLPAPEVVAELRSKWPVFFEITDRVAAVHKDVFKTSTAVVQVLFSDDIMTRYYSKETFFGTLCERTARIFDDYLSAYARQGKLVIRVLEVGVGTGLLTRYLCDAMKLRDDIIVEYVATDVSFALANSMVKTASYKHVTAKAYDLSRSPEEQGINPGTFDIVMGLHVLHATPDISYTLSSLQRLLVPGGSLIVVELDGADWKETPACLWYDFVFGSFTEWFNFADGRKDHCSLSADQWTKCLLDVGYEDVQTSVEIDGGAEFLFTAQRPRFDIRRSKVPIIPHPVFLTYKFGGEIALQRSIAENDVNQALSLWLLTTKGIDGDAAMGLSQTLVHEFTNWDIHLAVFDECDDESDRIDTVLRYREFLADDTVVHFTKDRKPFVPKAVISSPPPKSVAFDPSGVWVHNDTDIVQISLPVLQEYQVLIEVSAWSVSFSSYRGFVGSIVESRDSYFTPGQTVVGIAEAQVSNRIICHCGQVAGLSGGVDHDHLAEYALAMVVSTTALGRMRTTKSDRRLPPMRILVTDHDEFGHVLSRFLESLPFAVNVQLVTAASDDDKFDLIIIDSATTKSRPEVAFWHGDLFVWDTVLRQMFKNDPWSFGHLLEVALRFVTSWQSPEASEFICPWSFGHILESLLRLALPRQLFAASELSRPQPMGHALQVAVQPAYPQKIFAESQLIRPRDLARKSAELFVSTKLPLFDGEKAYILLGAVSDLGIHIALWMYQHGARYIVLTSRRGRKFLTTDAGIPTRQKVAYMESRDDLVLRLELSDATSLGDTKSLIQTFAKPLGGCFLMTLALSDGLFMNQTEESIRKACDAKVKVLQTFLAAVSVEKLDFLVFFSSVSALLGYSGQSNYAIGSTVVDGHLDRYPNAFSLIVPGLSHLGYLSRIQQGSLERDRFNQWTITPDELCACMEDGLLKLARGSRCSRYIPDLPWDIVHQAVGLSTCIRHLMSHQETDDAEDKQDESELIHKLLSLLDVSMSDFSPEVPFTAYGLDSLAATRLAEAIRPYATVSQMQLLGGMTWNQLEVRVKAAKSGDTTRAVVVQEGHTTGAQDV